MAYRFSGGLLDSEQTAHLRGLIAFTLSIEPKYVESLKRMIGVELYAVLMSDAKV